MMKQVAASLTIAHLKLELGCLCERQSRHYKQFLDGLYKN